MGLVQKDFPMRNYADPEAKAQELWGGGQLVAHGVAPAPFPRPENQEG